MGRKSPSSSYVWLWEEEDRSFLFCCCLATGTWLGRLHHSPWKSCLLQEALLCFLWALTPSWYMSTFHSMFFKIRFKNKLRRETEVFHLLTDRHFHQQISFYIHIPVYQLVYKVHITRNSSYSLMQCLLQLTTKMQASKTAILKSSSWQVNCPFSQLLVAKFFLNIYFQNSAATSLCLYEYMDKNFLLRSIFQFSCSSYLGLISIPHC